MARKKRTSSGLFGGVFGGGGNLPPPPDPREDELLRYLREGAKHPAWLQVRFADPRALVAVLRKKRRDIRSVIWFGYRDWVYTLFEDGICYDPHGHKRPDVPPEAGLGRIGDWEPAKE